jgi:hypothetical protein
MFPFSNSSVVASGRRLRRVLALALVAAAVAPGAALAGSGVGEPTSFSAAFSTQRVDAPSGLSMRTTGRPPAPSVTLAPAIRQRVTLPVGTRLRLRALPQCRADDAALAAAGAQAVCPRRTRVGAGRAEGVLDGTPTAFELAVHAIRGRLFFAAERDGMPLKQGFWGTARGRQLDLVVPTFGGRIAPTLFRARIAARPSGAEWLRTPRHCPATRRWRFHASFAGLADLTSTAPLGAVRRLDDTTPCRA